MTQQPNPVPAQGLSNFIGHKGRCFDIRYSPSHDLFITASEDGTAKIWNVGTKRCQSTLTHSKTSEVLRVEFLSSSLCCSGGSDGKVIMWSLSDDALTKHSKVNTIEHKNEESQIYACESVGNNLLITAADSQLYLWDVSNNSEHQCVNFWNFEALVPNAADHFGGPRNTLNEVYVFDAKIDPASSSNVAVALSDATIRMVDTRTAADPTVRFTLAPGSQPKYPGVQFGHATSINWSSDSNSLLVAMGSGKVVLLDMRMGTIRTVLKGHTSAAYGACFLENDRKCLTWSSDSTIRAFDLSAENESELKDYTTSYSSVLVKDTTVFSCCLAPDGQSLLCGGGTNKKETSFLGIPIQHLKSFW